MKKHRLLRRRLRLVDVVLAVSILALAASLTWWGLSHRRARAAAEPSRALAALHQAADDLLVPLALRDTTECDGRTVFTYVLDPARFELPFASACITRMVQQAGGEVGDGTDSGRQHRLLALDPITGGAWEVALQLDTRGRYASARPLLAVVVDDFGSFGGAVLDSFCQDTDPAVCFAIIPGQPYSREAMDKAAAGGHELLIHMPMEPISYPRNNPGPGAIYVDLPSREIRARVRRYIAELPLAMGANNHMGSLATTDRNVMDAALTELDDAGLYFIDSRTIASSVAHQMAIERGMRSLSRDIFLDDPTWDDATLDKHMQTLKTLLSRQGRAIVITHCIPSGKLRYLQQFLARIPELDAELAPVSALFQTTVPQIP
ncbi:MAG: divergent polysaccharide deacetylase family protein [Candidatus Cloacimonetes bacterium]|nr:divergent polysaccharide deacetylase family protein [Candidatus Cloacimonadota bacterium]